MCMCVRVYVYVCVRACVCACVCVSERERGEREREREREHNSHIVIHVFVTIGLINDVFPTEQCSAGTTLSVWLYEGCMTFLLATSWPNSNPKTSFTSAR